MTTKRAYRGLCGRLLLSTFTFLLMAASAAAQEFPVKPVRVVVPFPAGGPNDLAIRPLTEKLPQLLGQPFIVDNRAGANGLIGTEFVAKSPPDGHTLLVISSSYTINAALSAKLPFDPLRDLAAVTSIATSHIMLVVNPTVPARTAKEFVALAAARPGKLTYGSSGTNGSLHLGGELLSLATGIRMVHVPYKGAILSLTDVMGGHVDAMFIAAPAALAQVKAGKVRALAVASGARAPYLPDVPTFAESGYPEVRLDSRYGIVVAGPTSRELIARINAAFGRVLQLPDVRERYAGLGMEAAPNTPQEYAAYLRDDLAKWRKVAAAAKLTLQ